MTTFLWATGCVAQAHTFNIYKLYPHDDEHNSILSQRSQAKKCKIHALNIDFSQNLKGFHLVLLSSLSLIFSKPHGS